MKDFTNHFVMSCLALAAVAAAGCDDLGSPAELDRPRVLAVRIEPPHLPAGGTARVDVLVGDAGGQVAVVTPDSVAPVIDAPGLVGRDATGWLVTAPPAEGLAAMRAELGLAPTDPVTLGLDVRVTVDGESLTAIKLAALGSSGANPVIGGMTFAGTPAAGVVLAPIGDTVLAPDAVSGTGELSYAWYSSVGELADYRSEVATLTASEPREGQIVLVVRDDVYGVAWTATQVRVDSPQ